MVVLFKMLVALHVTLCCQNMLTTAVPGVSYQEPWCVIPGAGVWYNTKPPLSTWYLIPGISRAIWRNP